ncbi:hypothetical protein L1987_27590 [Smallanthus sonchifolius]|uniref:Uncharacterized protein n=1 Tax=Smallanthus sonchifolius TaxID=185202 RepID=A0ACB9IBJ0_9ASTR|nr:hypothetical protein L1987_27590 [Smallanthus sonchifolius]
MVNVFQTTDANVRTTTKPHKLQYAAEYRFVDNSVSKPVGAALIAPMAKNVVVVGSAATVQSTCSKCSGCESKPQSAPVCSVKVDNDEIVLYKHHNQIVFDELHKSLPIITDLKEAEKVLNEKIEALTNDLATMTDIKNVLVIQQEDLLVKLSKAKSEHVEAKVHIDKYEFSSKAVEKLLDFQVHSKVKSGLGYYVIPHPFNGNFTCSLEHKVDVKHLLDFPLSEDPILSTSKPEEETRSEDERVESIRQNVGEFVLREKVVSVRLKDWDAYHLMRMISCTFLKMFLFM